MGKGLFQSGRGDSFPPSCGGMFFLSLEGTSEKGKKRITIATVTSSKEGAQPKGRNPSLVSWGKGDTRA